MSIGNLNDNGNKSTNMPWQWKVLQGLQNILDKNCCDDILALLNNIDSYLTSAERTPNIISATGAGATPANIFSLSISNVGSGDGVINGVTLPSGATINFDGGMLNNTLSQLSYNATGTTFIITYIS